MFHLIGFPFFLVGAILYFLPTIIAVSRNKTNLVGILLVNLLLGWSVIGWIVALVWAVSTERVDLARPVQVVSAPQPARGFCPRCGQPDQVGSRFCPHCGGALS
ncbi:MAG TPA: superinfection immunity protein [Bryobacteraceae bacterium]|nr:superinfection immunity protein [Bryobacteraceae bacterium]